MKIKDLVKNKRLELRETQLQFAQRFNFCSHAAISDLERGVVKKISEDMLNFVLGENERQSQIEERLLRIETVLKI